METCRAFFDSNPSIYIPRVHRDLSSHRLCVMEFIHGIKASNVSALKADGIDTRHVASLCVEAFAEMIFQAPFLHVDPHAGNLLVRRDVSGTTQLVLLDHGMYNYPQEGFASFMQDLWLAMVSQDEKKVRELCGRFGMERFGQLLTLALTGRSLSSRNKWLWRVSVRVDLARK